MGETGNALQFNRDVSDSILTANDQNPENEITLVNYKIKTIFRCTKGRNRKSSHVFTNLCLAKTIINTDFEPIIKVELGKAPSLNYYL